MRTIIGKTFNPRVRLLPKKLRLLTFKRLRFRVAEALRSN
jgi:hypothetical protein